MTDEFQPAGDLFKPGERCVKAVLISLLLAPGCLAFAEPVAPAKPNILLILADDLGYGDLSCQNSASKIRTPSLDRLASQGMRFTDAHAPSAVCTPSRYGVLTGQYCWRSRLKSGVLNMWDEPLIPPERLTVAGLLRNQGYRTAAFGKWHLGLTWPFVGKAPAGFDTTVTVADIDWTGRIGGGPIDRGFDYYFGVNIANEPPYAFIENDHVVGQPTVEYPTVTGQQSHWAGPGMPGWDWSQTLPVVTSNTMKWIAQTAAAPSAQPFFVYLALVGPHQPIAPNAQFQGTSQAGIYGDYVQELDWAVGQVLSALETTGAATNTLVLFTSDNGPDEFAYMRLQTYGHASMGALRGIKNDIWEGGHRVPFLARWPGQIAAGTTNSTPIGLVGFMHTVADITGAHLPANAAEDSVSFLPALLGTQTSAALGETMILESGCGQFGLRSNHWMYIDSSTGDGHNPEMEPLWFEQQRGYVRSAPLPALLYDLNQDLAERTNLLNSMPGLVSQLSAQLQQSRARSAWLGNVSGDWATGGNWVPACLPTGADVVYSNLTSAAHLSQTFEGILTINSILMEPTLYSNLTISAGVGSELSIANGIDMSDANANLTLNAGLVLGQSQPWSVSRNHVLVVNGPIATRGCELTICGNGNTFLEHNISDSGRLTVRSSGYTVLRGTNSFSGGVELSGGGFLLAENDYALGAGALTIRNNSTLGLFPGLILTNAAAIQGQGAWYEGTRQGGICLSDSGRAGYNGSVTLSGAARFFVRSPTGRLALGGPVSGPGGLVKFGLGTLTLAGTNSYTGETAVSEGTLDVSGWLGNTAIIVNGGTLTGHGVTGPVTITNVGTLALTIDSEPLTISGELRLSDAGTTSVEIDSAHNTSGWIQGITSASYGGVLLVSNRANNVRLTNGQSFQLFSSAAGHGRFSQILPEPGPGLVWSFNPGSGTLTALAPPRLQFALATSTNLILAWTGPGFHLQVQTNCIHSDGRWFDYRGGSISPVTVPVLPDRGGLFLRLAAP